MTARAGLVPERTARPSEARRELERSGAVILSSAGQDHGSAVASMTAVLGRGLRAYREPVNIGTNPVAGRPTFFDWKTRTVNSDPRSGGNAHTDGYMLYGNAYPDVVLLLCVRAAPSGGESAVIDGYRLLGATRAADPELAAFLEQVHVEQSTPTGVPCRAPIATRTAQGRLALRCHDHQRPLDGKPPGPGHRDKIGRWHETVAQAAAAAPRFLLGPGDLLCVDNYRAFHLRDPYTGRSRLLLRVWAWTDRALGLPAQRAVGERGTDIVTAVGSEP
jgi:Taurine catabolism dioxygenase TauD, TfdA family